MEDYEEFKKYVKILLVDDDLDYIQVTAFFLKSKGYNVDVSTSGADALNKVSKGNIHIVLLDYYMPELTGEDVVNKIREFNNKIIIILQTGFAGQQPPEDTLQRLNIQNYHDKADGVEKLLLQVTAAVRIFNQQNQVALSNYRVNAMGKLIKGIAEELKSPLLSIGANIEATKTLITNVKSSIDKETLTQVNETYENSKEQLRSIDKVFNTLINQSSSDRTKKGLTINEIINTLEFMIAKELQAKKLKLEKDVNIDLSKYVYGNIDDVIFILCELIHRIAEIANEKDEIQFSIKESKDAWYVSVGYSNLDAIEKSNIYLISNIVHKIPEMEFEEVAGQFIIEIKK